MTFNDKIIQNQTLLTNASYGFQPPAGVNWMVRNLVTEGAGTLNVWKVSGGIHVLFTMLPSQNLLDMQLHCTNTQYYYFNNTEATSKRISYEVIVTNDGNIGDTIVSDAQSVLTEQNFNIQPPAGQEWVIHNIGCDTKTGNVYRIDPGGYMYFDNIPANSLRVGYNLLCTNTNYVQVHNPGVGTGNYCFDGIRTK